MRRILASSRYIMIVPVIGTFLGSAALILYEAIALCSSFADAIRGGTVSAKAVKIFAVGIVEAVDVFLIGIAVLAVLAVLFLREVVAWEGTSDIAAFGAGLALVVAALTFFLMKNNARRR